jgi:hypothetical protein
MTRPGVPLMQALRGLGSYPLPTVIELLEARDAA